MLKSYSVAEDLDNQLAELGLRQQPLDPSILPSITIEAGKLKTTFQRFL